MALKNSLRLGSQHFTLVLSYSALIQQLTSIACLSEVLLDESLPKHLCTVFDPTILLLT